MAVGVEFWVSLYFFNPLLVALSCLLAGGFASPLEMIPGFGFTGSVFFDFTPF